MCENCRNRGRTDRKGVVFFRRGSYTIEAAIWVSLCTLLYAGCIHSGIDLYWEAVDRKSPEKLEQFWAVQKFYREKGWKEILDDQP